MRATASSQGGSGTFTSLTVSSSLNLSFGTANGVAYLDGSKNVTTGTSLVFDGNNFASGGVNPSSTTNTYRSLEVGKQGTGIISFFQAQGALAVNYANLSNADKFAGTGYAGLFQFNAGAWQLFTTTASGTAGNAATLLQVMNSSTGGVMTFNQYSASTPTFTAGCKYLVVDSSGVIKVSALGPAS